MLIMYCTFKQSYITYITVKNSVDIFFKREGVIVYVKIISNLITPA